MGGITQTEAPVQKMVLIFLLFLSGCSGLLDITKMILISLQTSAQATADKACTEAHQLDPRLTQEQRQDLIGRACRDTDFSYEDWQCAAREVRENNQPIEAAKQRCGIK